MKSLVHQKVRDEKIKPAFFSHSFLMDLLCMVGLVTVIVLVGNAVAYGTVVTRCETAAPWITGGGVLTANSGEAQEGTNCMEFASSGSGFMSYNTYYDWSGAHYAIFYAKTDNTTSPTVTFYLMDSSGGDTLAWNFTVPNSWGTIAIDLSMAPWVMSGSMTNFDYTSANMGFQIGFTESFYVDYIVMAAEYDQPPVTTKTLSGPVWGNVSEEFYITSATDIWFTATGGLMGAAELHINVMWDSDDDGVVDTQKLDTVIMDNDPSDLDPTDGVIEYGINLFDEGLHEVLYYSIDNFGNVEDEQLEIDLVDNTPTTTVKEYGSPFYVGSNVSWSGAGAGNVNHYITSNTLIYLNTTDGPGICASGVNRTEYRVHRWDGSAFVLVQGWTVYNDSDPFSFASIGDTHECLHLIKIRSSDNLGNNESEWSQYVMVDNTPPESIKEIGTPKYGVNASYVTTGTPIWLNVTNDNGVRPCQVDSYLHYEIWWDSNSDGVVDTLVNVTTVVDNGPNDANTTKRTISYCINFSEECYHELWWYSADYLGNQENWTVQSHYVDDTPPTTVKIYGTPFNEGTPISWVTTDWSGDVSHYINSSTIITLNITDYPTFCASGVKWAQYRVYWWNESSNTWYQIIPVSGWKIYTGPFTVGTNEGLYRIRIRSSDNLGNIETAWDQYVMVDNTPPVTTKEYGLPFYVGATVTWTGTGAGDVNHYITSDTPIYLNSTDNYSGINRTEYRVHRWDEASLSFVVVQPWTVYTGPFNFSSIGDTNECLHRIRIRSSDNLGNAESAWNQYVMVDNTPPVSTKEIGLPRRMGGLFVTTGTPIWLNTTDTGTTNCIVGCNYTHYEVWWDSDGDHVVDMLMESGNASSNNVTIYFNETCYHELWWYGVDYLGNTENITRQQHYVDDAAPEITIEVGDPSYGINVTTGTPFWINITDDCNLSYARVTYQYDTNCDGTFVTELIGDFYDTDDDGVISLQLNFTEECCHRWRVIAYDEFGRDSGWVLSSWYRVDDTPPVTTKEIGNPQSSGGLYVTTGTPIWLNTTDGVIPCAVGCNYTHYEVWWDSDGDGVVDTVVESGDAFSNNVTIYFNETCYHELWWYGVDFLGNTEALRVQGHYVDDAAPVINISVGDPHYGINVTAGTPFWINVTDDCNLSYVRVTYQYDVDCDGVADSIELVGMFYDTDDDDVISLQLNFTEECCHRWRVRAYDESGKDTGWVLSSWYCVDDTPPVTTKEYGLPFYVGTTVNWSVAGAGYVNHYITSYTPIYLNATDGSSNCSSGVNRTEYTVHRWTGSAFVLVQGWTVYTGPFSFAGIGDTHECLHRIRVRSCDNLGNLETQWMQHVMVDNTPPETTKEIGAPQSSGGLYVTTDTPIWLNTTDTGTTPCRVGCNYTHYEVWWDSDGDGIVDMFVESGNAYSNNVTLYFSETCYHEIWWYGVDFLGNTEALHVQGHFADDAAPDINIDVGNPNYEVTADYEYYIFPNTPIWINFTDATPNSTLYYNISYNGIWYEFTNHTNVTFNFGGFPWSGNGDHEFVVWATDQLGNMPTTPITYLFHVWPTPTVDYTTITYCTLNEIIDINMSTNFSMVCYASAFNNTLGFLNLINVTWNIQNSGGSNASINTNYDQSIEFNSGWHNGTTNLSIDDGNGHSDTVEFIVNDSRYSMMFYKEWNLATVPFDNSWTAETLGQNISGCTTVCRFNASSQSYVTHVVGIPYNDFPIEDGKGYFVYCTHDSILSMPDLVITSVNVSIYEDWNIVGWYHEYDTTAESLGDNISNCTVVCRFNADSQSYTTHVVNIPYNDFTIERGMTLFIYATDASYWHGEG